MKKRWFLLTAGVLLALVVFANKDSETTVETVRATVLRAQRVEQTISCNGVVEAGKIEVVFPAQMCVVDEVKVALGQQVKAGDTLVTINKEATKQLQQTNGRLSAALPLATMSNCITAPVDGVVMSIEAATGVMLDGNAPCVTIAPTDGLQVRVLIREKQLPSLEVGQKVRVSGAGFDKKVYYGRLEEISGAASATGTQGVVEGVVCLDDDQADTSMRIGLTAKAKVIVSTVEDGLLIPYEAIVYEEEESYVYFWQEGQQQKQVIEPLSEYTGGVLVDQTQWVGKTILLEPDKVVAGDFTVQVTQEAVE